MARRRVGERRRLARVHRERLLHVHVRAGGEGAHGEREVARGRGGHVHHVRPDLREHRVEIRVPGGHPVARRRLLGQVRALVAHRRDRRAGAPRLVDVRVGDLPAPHHRHPRRRSAPVPHLAFPRPGHRPLKWAPSTAPASAEAGG